MAYIGNPAAPTLAQVSDNTITSAKIVDGTIATGDIADGAVTAAKLAAGAGLPDAIDVNASAPADSLAINASGNVGVGTTSPAAKLQAVIGSGASVGVKYLNAGGSGLQFYTDSTASNADTYIESPLTGVAMIFRNAAAEGMRLDSNNSFLVQMTTDSDTATGIKWNRNADSSFFKATHNSSNSSIAVAYFNRQNSDGTIIGLQQADTTEGTISVSGTTVSYNGGHLSRWAQTIDPKDETLVKGTVLSNLDEMNQYVNDEGEPVPNEQLNKVKVSDVEGDANVAGVFVNWSYDEQHSIDEINMAMTGDMIIRIAQGVTVQRGDLLMSAGDGTAKPQEDDIVRSKTIAKVTSTNVTCTYEDGSYCVPCVLMAC